VTIDNPQAFALRELVRAATKMREGQRDWAAGKRDHRDALRRDTYRVDAMIEEIRRKGLT
jgi:hypothetical protein